MIAKDAYHLLDRPGQVVLARLRSGHNRLNAHMHRKLKKKTTNFITAAGLVV